MNDEQRKWVYLFVLAFVWGSSFILIKKSLIGLTPIQLGALRTFIAGLFILAIGFKSVKKIKKHHWKYIFLSSLVGTLFPAFFFAYAITGIDSSVASILNSMTSLNALIVGTLFFGIAFKRIQLIGVLIGLVGTILLIIESSSLNPNQNYWFAIFVLLSSVGYSFNVNIIKKQLSDISAMSITVGHFIFLIIPVFLILLFSEFFMTLELTPEIKTSFGYLIILSIVGTGVAKIMFNKLVQISSPVFSTSVAYLIPIVAIVWGFIDGEKVSFLQLMAGTVILIGIYIVNKAK
ncbi:MAG: putative inner membrane transporter YedA [Flavobacterium sp. SCGC AAA160-P02]|nr:MAG: putative inner membrane transporter YedA [Flavobacterium sp. SCGC AAA160-P02]|tara:strand:+ start:30 stop:902 length:873 start_codon:yes stop_codon:yes gene_type:complete